MKINSLFSVVVFLFSVPSFAQHYQTDFPPDEFKARWQKVFDKIGDQAIAIVQGAPQVGGFNLPRQSNEFYYLCGIETPHAYLLLDGRIREVTLFMPPRNKRLESSEGKILSADTGPLVKQLTGVDHVASTEAMTGKWLLDLTMEQGAPIIYTPFSPAEGHAESRWELLQARASAAADYWDGGLPREARFIQLLKTRHHRVELRDLTPTLDEMRSIKSTREIALIRRASQLAGLGMMQAIRSTKEGIYEYQLEAAARYIFLVNGARMDAYRSITAAGTQNIWNAHYFLNTKKLEDGELVLMDYAPDYHYYVGDIGRMWPVSGKYSAVQREILQFVVNYRNVVLERIRPGVSAKQIQEEAKEAMKPVFAETKFSKQIYEAAARQLVESGGGVFSHQVGMSVHDVGSYRELLKPGHVFSVDPQLWVPEEHLYYRYEDTGVVTEDGFENFTEFLPAELDEIEQLVLKKGIVQQFPPSP
jgi:Xaa-Pro aminopeptidase